MFFPFSRFQPMNSSVHDPIGTPATPFVISSGPRVPPLRECVVDHDLGDYAEPVAGPSTGVSLFCPGPDFVECVTSIPLQVVHTGVDRQARSEWGLVEWRAFGERIETEAGRFALRYTHYREESQKLGVELATCIQLLQIQTENREHSHRGLLGNIKKLNKRAESDAATIRMIRCENMRLASLLSTHVRRGMDCDVVRARLDHVEQEKANLEDVVASMSETLTGFLERQSV